MGGWPVIKAEGGTPLSDYKPCRKIFSEVWAIKPSSERQTRRRAILRNTSSRYNPGRPIVDDGQVQGGQWAVISDQLSVRVGGVTAGWR